MKIVKIIFAILLFAVLGIIIFFAINIFSVKDNITTDNHDNKIIEQSKENENKISLKLLNKEPNIETTNILVEVQDDLENYEIKMPDNTISNEQKAEYKISENGVYKFILKLEDGTEIEKEIEVNNIKVKTENKVPTYIPEGFSYKEGTLETGYVISDQYGNEFVCKRGHLPKTGCSQPVFGRCPLLHPLLHPLLQERFLNKHIEKKYNLLYNYTIKWKRGK